MLLTKTIVCKQYGKQTSQNDLGRHQTNCSAETAFCSQCSEFSTKFLAALLQIVSRKHNASKLSIYTRL